MAATACAASCRNVTPTKNSAGASASCGTNGTSARFEADQRVAPVPRSGPAVAGASTTSEPDDVEAARRHLARRSRGLAVPGGLSARRRLGLDVEDPEQPEVAVVTDAVAARPAARQGP